MSELAQGCPFTGGQPDVEPLPPLDIWASRDQAQARIIGPLNAAVLFKSVDEYEQSDKRIERAETMHQRFNAEAGLEVSSYKPLASPLKAAVGGIGNHTSSAFRPNAPEDYLTNTQKRIFMRNTALEAVNSTVLEGYNAHVQTVFDIALPGYLIAQHGFTTAKQVREEVIELGFAGIANTLRRPDFCTSLGRLATTANGMLKRSNGRYVDDPIDVPVVNPLKEVTKSDGVHVRDQGAIPDAVSVYELYTKHADGDCKLSDATRSALKFYLDFRNNIVDDNILLGSVRGPSRGCPVVQTGTTVCLEDYTRQQWQDLTGGDNPVAIYNSESSRLTFKRYPFKDLTHHFADTLEAAAV